MNCVIKFHDSSSVQHDPTIFFRRSNFRKASSQTPALIASDRQRILITFFFVLFNTKGQTVLMRSAKSCPLYIVYGYILYIYTNHNSSFHLGSRIFKCLITPLDFSADRVQIKLLRFRIFLISQTVI